MALRDNLLSWWDLEESSGSRNDEVGANDLTDNNTVTSGSGKVGTAALFTRTNSEYLEIASASQSPDLSINGSNGHIFICAWVYLASKPAAAMQAVTKYAFSAGNREYALYWDNTTDRFTFIVFNSGATSNSVVANTFGAPSTGTWYFLMAWVDNTANTVNISVNNGTVDSVSLTITTHNGTAAFRIGAAGNATPIEHWDGYIDSIGIFSAVKDTTDRALLYNGGNGVNYAQTAPSNTEVGNLMLLGVG